MRPSAPSAARPGAVEPEHRLVARGLEQRLGGKALCAGGQPRAAANKLREHRSARAPLPPRSARRLARARHGIWGGVWSAPTTTDRDRKVLRCLIEEVDRRRVAREERRGDAGPCAGAAARSPSLASRLRNSQPAIRTDEDTIALLAPARHHYDDGDYRRRSSTAKAGASGYRRAVHGGHRRAACAATAASPPTLRPPIRPTASWLPIRERRPEESRRNRALDPAPAAQRRLHRRRAGDTPGAPWRIRVNDKRGVLRSRGPDGFVPIDDAMRQLSAVSRQTVLQRVKRGELKAVHVSRGRRKGLRIRVPADGGLFDAGAMNAGAGDDDPKARSKPGTAPLPPTARIPSDSPSAGFYWRSASR